MIVFCATDAGPAKYLIPLIQQSNYPCRVYGSSVSISIFGEAGIEALGYDEFCEELEIDLAVLGTTLGNTFEKKILERSKLDGFKVISIIEHWTNFKERFFKDDQYLFPDHIFVNDAWAKEQAILEGLPAKNIEVVGNPVLEAQQQLCKVTKNRNIPMRFLFISERLDTDMPKEGSRYLGYNQYDVLDDIVGCLSQENILHLKLHPTETVRDYSNYLTNQNVEVISADTMRRQLSDYQAIIGMESMLLLEMAAQGFLVFSYRPNANRSFVGCEMRWVSELDKAALKLLIRSGEGKTINSTAIPNFSGSLDYILKIIRNFYENSSLNSG